MPTSAVEMTAGFQVPVIAGLSVEELERGSGASFWQYGPNWSKVGVISGVISISIVVESAHSPDDGVKVKVKIPG